ncbi:hypothetical protein Ahy_B06g080036 [Arachis hypogaea]|uniref:Ubiquitin-like protease family profile domain-containing protein n=1 Tax=Arachis hypogaea TaxID=3818 RepID=A0A444YGX9_ARAHY|nr:hypothetical protein Ahy_B06g080036 [Arachis hypogaea]
MPSFSLGLTDSSQEEAATLEEERAKTPETPKLIEQLEELVEKIASSGVKTEGKSPQIQKQSGEKSFKKFETLTKTNEMLAEMKEKCYIWATRVKTYRDGGTNEYNAMCTLSAQDRYILSKVHFASLKADTHIEAEHMVIGNHPNGEFLQPKTNKPFRVEYYPMFIPFLDLKKLASHPYIFALVCYSNHWWLWVADARKRNFFILDPYHKTCPSDARMNLNKFIVSCFFVFYDCGIYVMKWLEIIQPENVKRGKYEWDNWTQILFHEMNHDKAEAISGSDAIRLSKPSSLLLSPYC